MSESARDPIIEEIREIRRKMMEDCGNDLSEFSRRLRESQKRHADKLVCRKPVPLVRSKTG